MSSLGLLVSCRRCAINTTPQMVSDTTIQLEKFMEEAARTRGHHKSVKSNIMEVRRHLLATLIVTPIVILISSLFFQMFLN